MNSREKWADHAHGSDEAIALTDYGLQKTRLLRIVTQSSADLAHDVVDVALGIDEPIWRGLPEPGDDILSGHQLLSPRGKENEQLHRLLFQIDAMAGAAKLVAA